MMRTRAEGIFRVLRITALRRLPESLVAAPLQEVTFNDNVQSTVGSALEIS